MAIDIPYDNTYWESNTNLYKENYSFLLIGCQGTSDLQFVHSHTDYNFYDGKIDYATDDALKTTSFEVASDSEDFYEIDVKVRES